MELEFICDTRKSKYTVTIVKAGCANFKSIEIIFKALSFRFYIFKSKNVHK